MQLHEYNKSQNTYYEGDKFSAWQIMDWFTDSLVGVNAFNACNVIKYLIRYDRKGTPKQDLQKALNYLRNVSVEPTDKTYNAELLEIIIQDFIRTKNDYEELYFTYALRNYLKSIITGEEKFLEFTQFYIEKLKELY